MSDFFRFPHTPHLAWLGEGVPRDDKVWSVAEQRAWLQHEVVVEEKLDGANLGWSLAEDGALRAQNRGQYLTAQPGGQFSRLAGWQAQHETGLRAVLRPELRLFGEWCAARHTLSYQRLPDWFLLFDVYDRAQGVFWGSARRDALAEAAGLCTVRRMAQGKFSLANLMALLQADSPLRAGPPEGLILRQEDALVCHSRAKLVRADFSQSLQQHWRSRTLDWNRCATDQPPH